MGGWVYADHAPWRLWRGSLSTIVLGSNAFARVRSLRLHVETCDLRARLHERGGNIHSLSQRGLNRSPLKLTIIVH